MRVPISLVILLLPFILVPSQACTPPYWQIQKNVITINQADKVAGTDFTLAGVGKVHNATLAKAHVWNITNIAAKSVGSTNNVAVKTDIKTVNVDNYFINLTLSYKTQSMTGKSVTYNGTGTTTIAVNVNYVKEIVLTGSEATFKYVSSVVSFSNITSFFSPNPNDEDKTTFNNLIQADVVALLKTYYTNTLTPSLKSQIDAEKASFTFGGNYLYKFNNFTVDYQMQINAFQVVNKTNLAIGYNASINGNATCAKSPKPYDETSTSASFFSNEFCNDLFVNSLENNKEWASIDVDSKYSSNIFEFEMKDITNVIPEAIKTYPGLFAKLYVVCNSTHSDSTFEIDALHKKLHANALWNCTLFRQGGYGLAGFVANISYTTNLGQENKKLVNNISSMSLDSVQYYPLLFTVDDQDTATLYIKSVLSNFVMTQTLGSDFLQPQRTSPVFDFAESYIKISNAVGGVFRLKESLFKASPLLQTE